MPQLERIGSRYQLVPLTFMQDAVAASQTDVQLPIAEVNAAAGNAVDGYVMPFDGEIIGISARLSAAATTGTLTVGPTVNGTERTDPTLSITTSQSARDIAPRGSAQFVAGDLIGAEITSGGTWDGTTADLGVVVWVMLTVDGI
jgi:hypothetical protein